MKKRKVKIKNPDVLECMKLVKDELPNIIWLGVIIAIAHSILLAVQKLEHYKKCWIARDIPIIGKRICDKYHNGKFLCEVS